MPALIAENERGHGDRLAELTAAELAVLSLVAEGLSNTAIASELVLSVRTVEGHINRIFRKLNLFADPLRHPRVAAVIMYLGEHAR